MHRIESVIEGSDSCLKAYKVNVTIAKQGGKEIK